MAACTPCVLSSQYASAPSSRPGLISDSLWTFVSVCAFVFDWGDFLKRKENHQLSQRCLHKHLPR